MIHIGLEKDFVDRVGQELDKFHWKNDKTAVCRCHYCGDSKKNKNKTRGYFYVSPKANSYFYKCHNCGVCVSLYDFLEFKNTILFNQMKLEYIKQKRFEESYMSVETKASIDRGMEEAKRKEFADAPPYIDPMLKYPTLFELDVDHRARKYAESIRKLPKESLMRIYFVEDFAALANELDDDKDLKCGVSRIVFPLYTKEKRLFGVSARCIGSDSDLRYITIKEQDSIEMKIYGLERLDDTKDSYCVEGSMDSEFLPNCISLSGAGALKKSLFPFNTDKMTMIFDNEPRNEHIVKYMAQCIDNGFKVCIWGKDFKYRDINEAIQDGWTSAQIEEHVKNNSAFGLKASIKLGSWKV